MGRVAPSGPRPDLNGPYGFNEVLPAGLNPDVIYEIRAYAVAQNGAVDQLRNLWPVGGAPPPARVGVLECGELIPAGAVVVGSYYQSPCVRTTVAAPQPGLIVCAGHLLPRGWQKRPGSDVQRCSSGFGSGVDAFAIEYKGAPAPLAPFACLPSAGCGLSADTVGRPFDRRCLASAAALFGGNLTSPAGDLLGSVTMYYSTYYSTGCAAWWTTTRAADGKPATAVVATMRRSDSSPYLEYDPTGNLRYVNAPDRFYEASYGVNTEVSSMLASPTTGGQPEMACGQVRSDETFGSFFGACFAPDGRELRLDQYITYGGIVDPDPEPTPAPLPPGVTPEMETDCIQSGKLTYEELGMLLEDGVFEEAIASGWVTEERPCELSFDIVPGPVGSFAGPAESAFFTTEGYLFLVQDRQLIPTNDPNLISNSSCVVLTTSITLKIGIDFNSGKFDVEQRICRSYDFEAGCEVLTNGVWDRATQKWGAPSPPLVTTRRSGPWRWTGIANSGENGSGVSRAFLTFNKGCANSAWVTQLSATLYVGLGVPPAFLLSYQETAEPSYMITVDDIP